MDKFPSSPPPAGRLLQQFQNAKKWKILWKLNSKGDLAIAISKCRKKKKMNALLLPSWRSKDQDKTSTIRWTKESRHFMMFIIVFNMSANYQQIQKLALRSITSDIHILLPNLVAFSAAVFSEHSSQTYRHKLLSLL